MAEQAQRLELPPELTKFITDVGTSIGNLQETVKNLNTRLDGLKPASAESKKKEPPSARSDLETLPRTEFLKIILEEVRDALGGEIKEVKDSISNLDQSGRSTRIGSELDRLRKEHLDFSEFEKEMIEIAKVTPGITPERAYKLAKLENPDKAKEMTEKYKTADEKKREEEEAQRIKDVEAKKLNPFGGLTPTSGKVAKDDKPKSTEEASEEAWEEVFGAGAE